MQNFGIGLKVKDFGKKIKFNFSLKHTTTMKKASINVKHDNMSMNYTKEDNMAMNGKKL